MVNLKNRTVIVLGHTSSAEITKLLQERDAKVIIIGSDIFEPPRLTPEMVAALLKPTSIAPETKKMRGRNPWCNGADPRASWKRHR